MRITSLTPVGFSIVPENDMDVLVIDIWRSRELKGYGEVFNQEGYFRFMFNEVKDSKPIPKELEGYNYYEESYQVMHIGDMNYI